MLSIDSPQLSNLLWEIHTFSSLPSVSSRESTWPQVLIIKMQRISKISGALSGSYLQLCRCSLSWLAQIQLALGDDDVVLPKMPHFDYFYPPYTRLSAVEILKKRQEYLSPSLFHFYSNLVRFFPFLSICMGLVELVSIFMCFGFSRFGFCKKH